MVGMRILWVWLHGAFTFCKPNSKGILHILSRGLVGLLRIYPSDTATDNGKNDYEFVTRVT